MPAGKANPAPPVGPALGAKGVNIMQFCKEYNAATQDKIGTIIPVEITVYEVGIFVMHSSTFIKRGVITVWVCLFLLKSHKVSSFALDVQDRSFTFILKTPPASVLLKKAAGIETGSGTPNSKKVGKVTLDQVREIASIKLPDLNCEDVEAAMNTIKGTARNMGITVEE